MGVLGPCPRRGGVLRVWPTVGVSRPTLVPTTPLGSGAEVLVPSGGSALPVRPVVGGRARPSGSETSPRREHGRRPSGSTPPADDPDRRVGSCPDVPSEGRSPP